MVCQQEAPNMTLFTLEKFECEGDVSSVSVRWERWKRSLSIYLEAAGVDTDVKKRASLLHLGGHELQEIYYNIPGAHLTSDKANEGNLFETAVQKLDEYFAPKQSKVYERHIFRLLKQEPDEKFERFLVRLRQQAMKCKFTDKDEHIIDQITEKCKSEDLRKKILKTGDSMTLDQILMEANTLEAVQRQLENFEKKNNDAQSINKIDAYTNKEQFKRKLEPCGRCGSVRHLARDAKCPAKGKACLKCGIIGHFRNQCRTKVQKRKLEQGPNQAHNANRRREINDTEETNMISDKNIDYIFNINDDTPKVTCNIGGSQVTMLIDSGCKHNLLTDQTWKIMKTEKVKVVQIRRKLLLLMVALLL